jgi:hypothetical protein
MMDGCNFEGCIWKFDLLIHDAESWRSFIDNFGEMVERSLPRSAPTSQAT